MRKNNVFIETLGCSKNLVDSEYMVGSLKEKKYNIVTDPSFAKFIIINTCSFINDSKKESIDFIFEMISLKKEDDFIIVTGCLAQRYASELLEEIPEIDAYVGTSKYYLIADVLRDLIGGEKYIVKTDDINHILPEGLPRTQLTPRHYAFVKIAEGCDNKCTYCIIPKLRGKFRSRKIEDIVTEVEHLVEDGIKEVILIAQDTTRYGIDIYGEFKLSNLLDKLNNIEGLQWIRIQYMYPDVLDENIINAVKRNDKVVNYFDIPVQHSTDKILKLMNRHTTKKDIESVLDKIRNIIPNAVIRTTIIVGFPGETEEDFNSLLKFLSSQRVHRLGAFKYSNEENTPSYLLPNQVNDEIKDLRFNRLMQMQSKISNEHMKNYVGTTMDVIIDEKEQYDSTYIGRTKFDTPEVDGIVFISSTKALEIGSIYKATITDSLEYDLIGVVK